MSPRKDRAKVCARKIQFTAPPPEEETMRPYQCSVCGQWHMTTKRPADFKNSKVRWRMKKRAKNRQWPAIHPTNTGSVT